MIRAFSFPVSPERGRLRGWLEGSLAGLCELHWLRERQEYRVQQALRLAQPGMGGAEAEDEEDAEEDEDAAAARRAAAALEEQLVVMEEETVPSHSTPSPLSAIKARPSLKEEAVADWDRSLANGGVGKR